MGNWMTYDSETLHRILLKFKWSGWKKARLGWVKLFLEKGGEIVMGLQVRKIFLELLHKVRLKGECS